MNNRRLDVGEDLVYHFYASLYQLRIIDLDQIQDLMVPEWIRLHLMDRYE